MPPKKINKKPEAKNTVKLPAKPVVKSFKQTKNVSDDDNNDNENDDNVSETETESEEEQIEEKVVNTDEEDEDNLDDDVEEVEYKDAKEEMEEIDDTDEEDVGETVDTVREDDDKSINEDAITGQMDIADCLLDDDEEIDEVGEATMVEPNRRISRRKLTKYERVRLLAARTKQLALGAPPKVKNVDGKSPIEIAEIELAFNMIPFKIKRPLPNNTYEIWKLSELEK